MTIKASIPAVEGVQDQQAVRILSSLKLVLETITGRRVNVAPISKLGPDATTAGIINKVNELIDRLQS